jgi:Amt family ammonium transporter
MAIEIWLPALLGYLIPAGLFLLAWGGMRPERARRAATLGALALALAALGYYAVGFAFHLGGAGLVTDPPPAGLEQLDTLWGEGAQWGFFGLEGFFLGRAAQTPEAQALFITYLPLVAAAVLLVVLSLSEAARGWQMVLAGVLVSAVFFPLAACWVWGGGWLAQAGSPETLGLGHGFVDHAGSAVVYLLGSGVALGALLGLGARRVPDPLDAGVEMPPAHFPLLANLGALLFGLGWLGWSLSTPFHVAGATLNVPHIAVNGLLAGAGAVLTAQLYCWLALGHADSLMVARGAAAGWVAVSAGAPFIPAWAALLVGALAGFALPLSVYLVERVLRLPDETATVSLGLVPGLLGVLAVAIFATGMWGQGWNGVGVEEYRTILGQGVTGFLPVSPFVDDGRGQLIAQLAGLGAIGVPALLLSWLLFFLLNLPYRRVERTTPEPPRAAGVEGEEDAEAAPAGGLAGFVALLKANLIPTRRPPPQEDAPEEEGEPALE